ncbi:restriction endonuclease subunit S [Pseudomonas putida]|uniref:Restriction endonuclease subunit S n=1 Tax=Pseudomonas putida TaxID=303 RepID=A0A4D6XGB5_PSEPU|nr:restriction endonuclease subunit S [Pseudomonas putida]QCI13241.1 restriction endonuclease subunit S [Pseudomonas putida]
MTTLLTDNLPLLAGAPNGIKKLRELILELAVRGKLVPQDPSDEPASELLKRIAEEKARLVAEGKIKKQKALSERDAEDPAFELPAGWACARLADVVNVLNGRAYKKEELLDAGTPVLRVGNLFTSNHWYYSTLTLEEDKYCNPGDLLFAWSASFGPFIWHGERSIYHYHIWKLDFYAKGQLSKHYLYNYLLEQTQEIKAAGHGVSMVHMTKEKMERLVLPVPPLAEQDRIVAKVDELMALCDRLEAQQTDIESAHAQLVQALLNSLTQASNATDFGANWHRMAEHFHTLFTNDPSIDALKQTLLQLAVMGKLVPQDPSDEPASELLKRIAEGKKQLLIDGKLKKEKPLLPLEDLPFELPKNWSWSRLGRLIADLRYGTATKCDYSGTGTPVLRIPNIGDPSILLDDLKYGNLSSDEIDALKLLPEDLLMIRSNGSASLVGKTAVVTDSVTHCAFAGYLIRIRFPKSCISSYYLQLAMKSLDVRYSIESPIRTTSGVKNINSTEVSNIRIPLPPLAEQHRIVAKVDQLMALCDRLKASLTQANQLNDQLASTVIEQAVG